MIRVLLEDMKTFLSVVGILAAPQFSSAGGLPLVRGKCEGRPIILSLLPNAARGDCNIAIRAVQSQQLRHGAIALVRAPQDNPALADVITASLMDWTREEGRIADEAVPNESGIASTECECADTPECDAVIGVATTHGGLDADCIVSIRSFIRVLARSWEGYEHAC